MRLPWAPSSWTLPALAIAAAIAYLALGVIPNARHLHQVRQELEMKRAFVEQAAGMATALEGTRQELERTVRYNQVWHEAAPRAQTFPSLLGQINALARESGVTPTRVDPEPIKSQNPLDRIPLVICCQGRFDQTFQFLQGIESLPATTWINEFRMEVDAKDGGSVKTELDMEVFADNFEISDQVDPAK